MLGGRRRRHRPLLFGLTVVASCLLAPVVPAAAASTDSAPAAQLLVKYGPTLDTAVDELVRHRRPLADWTGSDALDRLHRELGVRALRPLVRLGSGASGSPSAAWGAAFARARDRFPARARRARADAPVPDLSRIYVLELPPGTDLEAAAARYGRDPAVVWAVPDRHRQATLLTDDPFLASSGTWGQSYPDLWGMLLTDAPSAWDTATGSGIVVAVSDTGVDLAHPDLAANLWTNPLEVARNGLDDDGNGFVDDVAGWDFVDDDATPTDLNGHGTHVAGTVAAVGDNGRGVVGMAFGARVMAIRGLDAGGGGFDSELAEGIVYAAENGADVLNASWGGSGASPVLDDAIAAAAGLGMLVIAAAGNDGSDMSDFFPASNPQVIAVGATAPDDVNAFFSNYGDGLDVAAPGLDVLSLRPGGVAPLGAVVASDYVRLSGTSMAAPHVAGLVAVLLSAEPGLTLAETRSHVELNADQPGYPGYEGQPWNPFFGFGRIDAARVFDPPPLLAFFRSSAIDLHAFADQVLPGGARASWDFTSEAPIAWTLAHPSWLHLPPGMNAGTGPASVSFDLDTTGLVPGAYADSLALAAPATTNGGANLPAYLQVHRDERLGPRIDLDPAFTNWRRLSHRLRAASDGLGTLVVWGGDVVGVSNADEIRSARLDGAGTITATAVVEPDAEYHPLASGDDSLNAAIGFDGRNFLVVWIDADRPPPGGRFWTAHVKARRFGPDGHPLEAAPIVLESRLRKNPFSAYAVDVGFDGEAYTVLWTAEAKPPAVRQYERGEKNIFSVRRVGTDGAPRTKRRKVWARVSGIDFYSHQQPARIACVAGSCLVAWRELEALASFTYRRHLHALRLVGDRPAGDPVRVLADTHRFVGLVSDGAQYLLLADRFAGSSECGGAARAPDLACPHEVIGARVSAAGEPLDPNGFVVNTAAGPARPSLAAGLAYDGGDWVAAWLAEPVVLPPRDCDVRCWHQVGYQIFARRIAADGTVLGDELPGSLVHPEQTALVDSGAVAATRTQVVLPYVTSADGLEPLGVFAQRTLARTPAVTLPEHAIGAIGPLAVDERAVLAFTLALPAGFPEATTTFAATNLPPGAVFDAPTRTFRWMPSANEAGTYSAVRFEAADGALTVAEEVTITVAERQRSLGGTIRLPGGAPLAGVRVELKGMGRPRQVVTDVAGRYWFDGLEPGTALRVRIGKPDARAYRLEPAGAAIVLGIADRRDVDFTATPR